MNLENGGKTWFLVGSWESPFFKNPPHQRTLGKRQETGEEPTGLPPKMGFPF